jgi:hypothetical protein
MYVLSVAIIGRVEFDTESFGFAHRVVASKLEARAVKKLLASTRQAS